MGDAGSASAGLSPLAAVLRFQSLALRPERLPMRWEEAMELENTTWQLQRGRTRECDGVAVWQ